MHLRKPELDLLLFLPKGVGAEAGGVNNPNLPTQFNLPFKKTTRAHHT